MKREDIENVAELYVMENSPTYVECFVTGANWRIDSVWHRTYDRPEAGRLALVEYYDPDGVIKYRVDIFCGYEWREMCHYDKIIRYAYIEDLISIM